DRDGVIRAGKRLDVHVLHVVDIVDLCGGIGVPRIGKAAPETDIIAVINKRYLLGVVNRVEIGDDQIQVVHELDAGGGISGRIGPDQRYAQRIGLRPSIDRNIERAAVAGGQRVGR